MRVSGLLEIELLRAGRLERDGSASTYSTAIVPRLRHYYFRDRDPVVDVLVGQYWHLFGWQNAYHPASVQAQGLVGELYRATAAPALEDDRDAGGERRSGRRGRSRPPQRDSGKPQAEGGLRVMVNKWTGLMTNGASGTALQPLSVAVSGNFRDVTVPEMSLTPQALGRTWR